MLFNIDKQQKEAQERVEAALAEEARLKTVAAELEKANKKAITEHESLVKKNNEEIQNFITEARAAREALDVVVQKKFSEQKERYLLKEEVFTLSKKLSELEESIEDKKGLAIATESLILKRTEKLNNSITEKEKEIDILDANILEKQNRVSKQDADFTVLAEKHKREITEINKQVSILEESYKDLAKKEESVKAELSANQHKLSVVKSELQTAEQNKEAVLIEISDLSTEVESLTGEVAAAKEELRKVNLERINSQGFMEELANKEANLKMKYEAVGLEYK